MLTALNSVMSATPNVPTGPNRSGPASVSLWLSRMNVEPVTSPHFATSPVPVAAVAPPTSMVAARAHTVPNTTAPTPRATASRFMVSSDRSSMLVPALEQSRDGGPIDSGGGRARGYGPGPLYPRNPVLGAPFSRRSARPVEPAVPSLRIIVIFRPTGGRPQPDDDSGLRLLVASDDIGSDAILLSL